MKIHLTAALCFLGSLAAFGASPIIQEPESNKDFEWSVGIPGFLSDLDGSIAIDGVPAELDVEVKEILENLDMILALSLEARYKNFVFFGDGLYISAGVSTESPRGLLFDSGRLQVKEALIEGFVGYRVWSASPFYVDLYTGLRYTYLENSLSFHASQKCSCFLSDSDFSASTSWVDPLIGTRIKAPIWKPISVVGLGDLGGFGAGCDFTWRIKAGVEIQVTRSIYSFIGYQKLYQDYQEGGFKWKVDMHGPFMEFGFNF